MGLVSMEPMTVGPETVGPATVGPVSVCHLDPKGLTLQGLLLWSAPKPCSPLRPVRDQCPCLQGGPRPGPVALGSGLGGWISASAAHELCDLILESVSNL